MSLSLLLLNKLNKINYIQSYRLSTNKLLYLNKSVAISNDFQYSNNKRIMNIAIVGRPNTGKSTLFNRLVGKNYAIVSDVPGTTRDRKEGRGMIIGLPLNVVDTGGLDDRGSISGSIQNQIEFALGYADVILYMLDSRVGVDSIDIHYSKWLRSNFGRVTNNKSNKVIVLANKAEGGHLSDKILDTISDAYRLGLGEPIPISAAHGDGMSDLAQMLIEIAENKGLETNVENIKKNEHTDDITDKIIQIAIMGRPNVGKSSLLNAILGEERVITGETAGLTRDAIDVSWEYKNRKFRLVDTAGLTRIHTTQPFGRKSISDKKLEKESKSIGRFIRPKKIILPGIQHLDPENDPSQFSTQISDLALISAMNALRFAQIVLLVVEDSQGQFSKIDLQLAKKCLEEGRAVIVVANKRDMLALNGVTGKEYEEGVKKHCEHYLREFGEVCVISASAIHGEGIVKLLNTSIEIHDAWSKRIDTWVLNKWLKDALISTAKPRVGSKLISVKYITQTKARPPTYALFCNVTKLSQSYERFLRSKLQFDFKLQGIPIRFIIKQASRNEANKKLLKYGKLSRRGIGNSSGRGVGPKNRQRGRVNIKKDREKRLKNRKLLKTIKRRIRNKKY